MENKDKGINGSAIKTQSRLNPCQGASDSTRSGVSEYKKSNLTPLETELDAKKLEVPIITGTSQGSGEYFCRVGIGHPPSQAYMVLDTGSDINWVQCAPCADSYQQADPIFDPLSSSSFSQHMELNNVGPLTCQNAITTIVATRFHTMTTHTHSEVLSQHSFRLNNCLHASAADYPISTSILSNSAVTYL
ncbi:Peptidase A1 domain-containing protein [Forsythia ovata]|uniref:Peptidase A1 domain-containing protein n=1 Tax=Forsythia ovata TaxID=205694 RepID=A0ABD1XED4_9LAMI